MATLKVATPFIVQLEPVPAPDPDQPAARDARAPDAPDRYVFPVAGTYEDVPEEVAAHPYTQPHLEGYEPPPATPEARTVVMVPVEEPPPTQEEAAAALSPEQRAEIAKRRTAEQRATERQRAAEAAAQKPPQG